MESECLPFSSIPHTSRLFQDYLHQFDKVRSFYARSPAAVESWAKEERAAIRYPEERRQKMAAILERQNREFGAGQKTLKNIDRLRQGAAAVVTGQQVGLFGGPLFCLLKALSAALLAEKTGAVPVFWLATQDHDLEEVKALNLPAGDHVKKFTINVPHVEGAPVGSIVFDDEVTAAVQQIEALFGSSEITEILGAAYRKGETFGSAFAGFTRRFSLTLASFFWIRWMPKFTGWRNRCFVPRWRKRTRSTDHCSTAMSSLRQPAITLR